MVVAVTVRGAREYCTVELAGRYHESVGFIRAVVGVGFSVLKEDGQWICIQVVQRVSKHGGGARGSILSHDILEEMQ